MHEVQHHSVVLYYFANVEFAILAKIEMNRRNGEYAEGAVRLCLEQKVVEPPLRAVGPKLIRWILQGVWGWTARILQVCTSDLVSPVLTFRVRVIMKHSYRQSWVGGGGGGGKGNHNSCCGARLKVFSFSSFHHSDLFA